MKFAHLMERLEGQRSEISLIAESVELEDLVDGLDALPPAKQAEVAPIVNLVVTAMSEVRRTKLAQLMIARGKLHATNPDARH